MSLFNILRYSGTNLRSIDELNGLPEKLVRLYWIEAHIYYNEHFATEGAPHSYIVIDHTIRNKALPTIISNMVDWGPPNGEIVLPLVFKQALRKYNDDDI